MRLPWVGSDHQIDRTLSPLQKLELSVGGSFSIRAEELHLLGRDNDTFGVAMLLRIANVWYCASQEARMRYAEMVGCEISKQIASLKAYGATGIFEGGLLQLKFTRSFVKYVRLALAGNIQTAEQINNGFFKDLLNN